MPGKPLGKAQSMEQGKARAAALASLGKMAANKKLIAIIATAIILAAIIAALALQANAQNATNTPSVSSATVQKGNVATTIDSSGTISNTGVSAVEVPSSLEVTKLLASAGDTVEKGDKLAKVKKSSAAEALVDINDTIDSLEDVIDTLEAEDDATTEGSDTYYELVSYKAKLDTLNTLKKRTQKIYDSGYITATADGIIDSISETSPTSASSSSDTQSASSTTHTSGYAVSQTAETSGFAAAAISTGTGQTTGYAQRGTSAVLVAGYTPNASSTVHLAASESASDTSASDSSTETSGSDSSDDASGGTTDAQVISSSYVANHLQVAAPITGNKPQTSIDATDAYSGSISWNPVSQSFAANTSYAAQIVLTAKDGYAFSSADDYAIEISGATVSKLSVEGGNNTAGNRLCITAAFQSTGGSSSDSHSTDGQESSSASKQNNGQSGSASGGATLNGNANGTASANTATGTTSSDGTASGTSNTDTAYTVDTTEFAGIASSDKAIITLSVDELDIGSVEKKQNATVTLDAFEGQEFSGTVSKVSASSTSNGKYDVEVTLEREDGMLAGMSASAVINIAESNDVLVVPTSALVEQNGSYFVYTSIDDDGNPSGETQLEVGLSDGTQTEITSGLSEGDTVYYTKLESTGSDSVQCDMGGMEGMPGGGQGTPGGGGQGGPGGDGQAPSGGGQGGPGGGQGAN